jgi:hypothetical protein
LLLAFADVYRCFPQRNKAEVASILSGFDLGRDVVPVGNQLLFGSTLGNSPRGCSSLEPFMRF